MKSRARWTRGRALAWPRMRGSLGLTLLFIGACQGELVLDQRIDALEAKLQSLGQRLAAEEATQARHVASDLLASASFDVVCPVPWRELGPADQSLWSCRSELTAHGDAASCSVTAGTTEPEVDPRTYLEEALSKIPQLKAARRISGRETSLGVARAYQMIYEHTLFERPLRVLATVGVISDRAYAISCSATPETFGANTAMFQRITQSFRPAL